jgi:hypothetical protein
MKLGNSWQESLEKQIWMANNSTHSSGSFKNPSDCCLVSTDLAFISEEPSEMNIIHHKKFVILFLTFISISYYPCVYHFHFFEFVYFKLVCTNYAMFFFISKLHIYTRFIYQNQANIIRVCFPYCFYSGFYFFR